MQRSAALEIPRVCLARPPSPRGARDGSCWPSEGGWQRPGARV